MWKFFRKRRESSPNAAGGGNGNNFRHTDPAAIGRMVAELARRNVALNLEYVGGCFATRVLGVDAATRTFVFDRSRDSACNAAVLRSPQCRFNAVLGGVPVEFTIAGASERHRGVTPVFEAALPDALAYMQKRAAFRVRTPVANPFFCQGRLPNGGGFRADLYDLSVGGICCETTDPRLIELQTGVLLRGVDLHLGDGSYPVDLKLVAQRKVGGEPARHLAFAFVSLPADVERALQRIVLWLELKGDVTADIKHESMIVLHR